MFFEAVKYTAGTINNKLRRLRNREPVNEFIENYYMNCNYFIDI